MRLPLRKGVLQGAGSDSKSKWLISRLNFESCSSGQLLGKFFGQKVTDQEQCIDEIRKFYLGDVDLNLDLDFNNITTMFTDADFAAGSDLMVRCVILIFCLDSLLEKSKEIVFLGTLWQKAEVTFTIIHSIIKVHFHWLISLAQIVSN